MEQKTEKKLVGIEFFQVEELTPKTQLQLGVTSGFIEVRRTRGSPLTTDMVPMKGLPSDKLMSKIESSSFKNKSLI